RGADWRGGPVPAGAAWVRLSRTAPPDACRLVVPPPTPAPVAHSHAATDPARVSAARSLREGVHVPVRIAQSRGATATVLVAPLRSMSAACASAPACYARISSAVQEGPANQLPSAYPADPAGRQPLER